MKRNHRSEELEEIKDLVSAPFQYRKHVNYNRCYLDEYIPNETYYIDLDTRSRLYNMGNIKRDFDEYSDQFLLDLSWNSSRLEGSSYSFSETKELLKKGVIAKGKELEEGTIALNHQAGIRFLIEEMLNKDLTTYSVYNIHALLSDGLLGNQASCGQLRSIPIIISGSTYLPMAIPSLIKECFERIISVAKKIQDPFEASFFLMVHLPYLQPFEDVNKRVSRVLLNLPLLKKKLIPFSFIGVDVKGYLQGLLAVYELNRMELLKEVFIWGYQKSCIHYCKTRELGDPNLFLVRHRQFVKEIVKEIVESKMNKDEIDMFLEIQKTKLSSEEQPEFKKLIINELAGLHTGNIARYRLDLDAFESWKEVN